MKYGTGTGRWGDCYWEEKFDQPIPIPRRSGWVDAGRFFLPPPVVDITLLDGLWGELNSELGTLFDMAEEEDLEPEMLQRAAKIISRFVEQHYSGRFGKRKKIAGERIAPNRKLLIAKMRYADLTEVLQELSRFLIDAEQKGKTVVVSL